jgi:hypothetical protein
MTDDTLPKVDDSIPQSYRQLLIDDGIFVDDSGNNDAAERIARRYSTAFVDLQTLLEKYQLAECCTVNPDLLWQANLDYFVDIARLKKFHGHRYIQEEKIYTYATFWYLRNHPIQIVKADNMPKRYIHVNERIFSYWLIKNIATELESRLAPNIQIDVFVEKFENHDLVLSFWEKLYYTFRFRPYTQQSLLLMVEGFMTAVEFTLEIT